MGCPVSPILANMYMEHFEELSKQWRTPLGYGEGMQMIPL